VKEVILVAEKGRDKRFYNGLTILIKDRFNYP